MQHALLEAAVIDTCTAVYVLYLQGTLQKVDNTYRHAFVIYNIMLKTEKYKHCGRIP